MRKPFIQRLKERANPQQVVILALQLIPDSFAIAFSAITAYNFRFPDSATMVDGKPAIAQFEYRGILTVLVIAWIVLLIATGTYRFNHATLVVFNLRMIIKRSVTYFFVLGFLSFILKASFSRSVFLVMLGSGIVYLFINTNADNFMVWRFHMLVRNNKHADTMAFFDAAYRIALFVHQVGSNRYRHLSMNLTGIVFN